MKEAECITVDCDGFVEWNPQKEYYNSESIINEIKEYAMNHRLLCVNDTFLLWQVPPELFKAFKKVYVLTYMFEASILHYYFRMYGIDYEKKAVMYENGVYSLADYKEADTRKYQELIKIFDGPINYNFYQKTNGLSKSWFNSPRSAGDIKQLKNNMNNFFRNINKAKKDEIMWTTFKDVARKLQGRGYSYVDVEKYPDKKKDACFVPCNARATNAYSQRHVLAYCVNRYMHPELSDLFAQNGITVDEEKYALSEMLQWIWRSSIRNGEPVKIYIPSKRMRVLLYEWLDLDCSEVKVMLKKEEDC